jgi:TonB family protein
MFPESKAVAAQAPELTRSIESAGFDPRVQSRAQQNLGQASVGAFDIAQDASTHRSATQDTSVADSGFNRAAPRQAPRPHANGAVRDSGFGAAPEPERAAPTPGDIRTAGFSDARAVQRPVKRAETAAAKPSVIPVEVLSKPTPVYTDEGRRLKVEGAVVLEVEFAAEGSLRVLRVVRGLGHGLDEAAMRAAEQIRFKPATSEGHPVDYRTTVQIVFRLA